MILLDTNVVSEVTKRLPNHSVIRWINVQSPESVNLTPVLAELRYGLERLPRGRRKDLLAAAVEGLENELYCDRILSFDVMAAGHYARLMAERERRGRRPSLMDGLIAAFALTHGAILATRDAGDFTGLGLELVNPFDLR